MGALLRCYLLECFVMAQDTKCHQMQVSTVYSCCVGRAKAETRPVEKNTRTSDIKLQCEENEDRFIVMRPTEILA